MFEFMVLREGDQRYFFDLPDGGMVELSTHPIDDSCHLRVVLDLQHRAKCGYKIIGNWGPMAGHQIIGEINEEETLSLLPGDYKFDVHTV